MTQSNIIVREQAVYFGEESTFGSTPGGSFPNAMTRTIVSEPITADGAAVEMLDVNDVRVRRLDAIQPVHGLKIASKFTAAMLLKQTPSAAQLISGNSPASLTPRLFLRHGLGTEYAAQGSTVATGTSSTSFDVAAGHGNRFRVGTYIAVQVSGAMEWAYVTAISTDTLTVTPALSGTPAMSAIVRNLYNYAPADSHTNSLTAQIAYVGDVTAQYTFNGCHGSLKFGYGGEWGKLASMSLDLTASSFTGPSNQSLSTATASDEMGASFAFTPQVYLTASTITRGATLACEKIEVDFPCQWEMVRDPSATQTVVAVVDTAGRPRAGKVMLTLRYDGDYPPAFDADSQYSMVVVQRYGSGTTASFWLWGMLNMKLTAQPKMSKVGERLYLDLEFSLQQSNAVAPAGGESAAQLDAIYAPLGVAFG